MMAHGTPYAVALRLHYSTLTSVIQVCCIRALAVAKLESVRNVFTYLRKQAALFELKLQARGPKL